MLRAVSLELMYLLFIREDGQIHILCISLFMFISVIPCDIYLSPLPHIGGYINWALACRTSQSHCSLLATMARKGSSSSTWKKFKTKQQKRASLQKRRNQRCMGCLRKSCPKKFNDSNEDKCGEFINFLFI